MQARRHDLKGKCCVIAAHAHETSFLCYSQTDISCRVFIPSPVRERSKIQAEKYHSESDDAIADLGSLYIHFCQSEALPGSRYYNTMQNGITWLKWTSADIWFLICVPYPSLRLLNRHHVPKALTKVVGIQAFNKLFCTFERNQSVAFYRSCYPADTGCNSDIQTHRVFGREAQVSPEHLIVALQIFPLLTDDIAIPP